MPLSDAEREQFGTQGYALLPGLLIEDEIAALKRDMDALTEAREAGGQVPLLCEYPSLGMLISHPATMEVVEQVMGPGFGFHHLHAVRQGPGTPGVHWHQDYEQEPQTNRSHVMVHVFYYLNGLNGEVGDLLLVPGTQTLVVANGGIWKMGTEPLPGCMVVDDLPHGSAVLVHSALWHARRAKPGGEDAPRYFADISYCQAGVQWPSYSRTNWREILARCRERGIDRGGRYAHLFDENHFFDRNEIHARWKDRAGSLALQLPDW